MKQSASLLVAMLALMFSSILVVSTVAAQSPQEECGQNTFLVKLDNIPDLEVGETYTGEALGTDGVTYTITVRFDGPNQYTLVSSSPALPQNAILVAKFGEGGGLSHLTVCVPPVQNTPTFTPTATIPNTPTFTPTATIPNTPTFTPTATDVPPTATDVPPTSTATTVPGQPTPTDIPPTATDVPDKPTDVPKEPEPTKPAPAVTTLPSTGSDGGSSTGGHGLILLVATAATLIAGIGAVLTDRTRSRSAR